MIACYDLKRCPPTYDVVAFLALLELERIARGEEKIDLHILPGPAGGFRADSLWPPSIEERVKLRENVLAPLCKLLPSINSVTVRTDRNVEGWGKDQYHISLPAIVKALRAGSRPLRASFLTPDLERVEAKAGQQILTFTLRESEHHPLRNSRVAEWIAAAKEIEWRHRPLKVMFIRDAAKAHEAFEFGGRSTSAAERLEVRARVYSKARLNVGISNGPMWLSIFMDAPTLMLRPTTNEAEGCYDDRFFKKYGLNRGDQLPTSPAHQRLVWEEDTRENIVRAVEDMLSCT